MMSTEDASLPEPKPDTGGPRKVLFDEGVRFIIGRVVRRDQRLNRFKRFLIEGLGWSAQQVSLFLEDRRDRWPPIECPIAPGLLSALDWSPELEELLRHPARATLLLAYTHGSAFTPWLNYGGFLYDELPALRAAYQCWWEMQTAEKLVKNLAVKKTNAQL